MGGLYISPSSSEISWKRRALRVSSEALLCLGVATLVASFVVDTHPGAQKPNIYILMGGIIMMIASAIGWSLTFCLMFDADQQAREHSGNNFTGIVVRHTKEHDLPMPPKTNKVISDANGNLIKPIKVKVKKMKAVDKNAPIHSVEVVVPQAFLQQGGNIATLPEKISPNMFDQFFSTRNISASKADLVNNGSGSEYSGNSQLPGYSKMPQGKYDPELAQKLGKIPPIPRDQKKITGYNTDNRVSKEVTDKIAKERERARSKRPAKITKSGGNNRPKITNTNRKDQNKNHHGRKEKVHHRRSDTESSSQSSVTNTYSTETETLSSSSYTDSRTESRTSRSSSYSDSYSQDYEEVKYDKKTGERLRKGGQKDNGRNKGHRVGAGAPKRKVASGAANRRV